MSICLVFVTSEEFLLLFFVPIKVLVRRHLFKLHHGQNLRAVYVATRVFLLVFKKATRYGITLFTRHYILLNFHPLRRLKSRQVEI